MAERGRLLRWTCSDTFELFVTEEELAECADRGDLEVLAVERECDSIRVDGDTEFLVGFDEPLPSQKRGHWEDDPNYPSDDWRYEVANNDTRLGYAEWVERQKCTACGGSGLALAGAVDVDVCPVCDGVGRG